MPKEKPAAKRITNGLVQNEIKLTESELYMVDRERYFNGKRVHEIPSENRYTLEQRIDNGKN